MAKGFNWVRAAKERVVRERGHEPLSPDDHTVRKGIPAPASAASKKSPKNKRGRRTEADVQASIERWAKAVCRKRKGPEKIAKEAEAAKAKAEERAKRRAEQAAAQAEARARRLAKAAEKRAAREAKLAAMPRAQREEIERRRVLQKDVRLRGVIVERKRPPRVRGAG